MRSAAAVSAAATAACALWARSAAAHARLLHRGQFLLQTLDAHAHLGQFVGDGERRHHGEPGVADLAEFGAQALDARVEIAGEVP